jgi:hypothetical protein
VNRPEVNDLVGLSGNLTELGWALKPAASLQAHRDTGIVAF